MSLEKSNQLIRAETLIKIHNPYVIFQRKRPGRVIELLKPEVNDNEQNRHHFVSEPIPIPPRPEPEVNSNLLPGSPRGDPDCPLKKSQSMVDAASARILRRRTSIGF